MWTILRSLGDWEKYQKDVATQLGLSGVIPVAWGNGPQAYPCLVCTHCPPTVGGTPRLVSAYVYEQDAEALLSAAGRKMSLPDKTPDGMPARQQDFNRWTMGNILAIVKGMRDIKATTPARYEQDLAEALALVDEEVAARREKLTPEDKAILDHLEPRS